MMRKTKVGCQCNSHSPIANLTIDGQRILARLERETPSGSHKDYAGKFKVADMTRRGEIGTNRHTRLVVPSSGNFGHSIATHTIDSRVEVTIVTDVLSPKALIDRFRRYPHVHIECVNCPDETGSHILARLKLIEELKRDDSRLIVVDQYNDPLIPLAYQLLLVPHLFRQLREDLSAVFVAVGTGGLANAFCQFRRQFGLTFKIFAVDAAGSCLGRPPRHGVRRHLSGYGNGTETQLATHIRDDVDRWIFVDDQDAVAMCHRVLENDGVYVGPSSGAVLASIEKMLKYQPRKVPASGNLVAILPDGGEPYAETVFNPAWLRRQGLGTFLRSTPRSADPGSMRNGGRDGEPQTDPFRGQGAASSRSRKRMQARTSD